MNTWRWIGIVLTVLGIAGFFTIADDLRHHGELIGVGTILALGMIALVVSWFRRA